MLNYIWSFMLLIGFICGIFNGKLQLITNSILLSSKSTLDLCLGLLGTICLWSGLINIADKCGILNYIANFLNPIINFLFPDLPKKHPAKKSIVMNITSNFLGLGNASTPFGIKAMQELQQLNKNKNECSNSMAMFLILNNVCPQLIPTTMISIRASMGSKNPTEIIRVVWLVSFITILFTIILTKIFQRIWR